MRVIGLAAVVSLGLALTSLAGEAQPAEKVPRVGILGIGPVPSPQDLAKSVSTNPFWMSSLRASRPMPLHPAQLARLTQGRESLSRQTSNLPLTTFYLHT